MRVTATGTPSFQNDPFLYGRSFSLSSPPRPQKRDDFVKIYPDSTGDASRTVRRPSAKGDSGKIRYTTDPLSIGWESPGPAIS